MNNSAFIIMLIFSYQMKEVVFVVLAIKHLVKTKRNVQSCGFDTNNFDGDYDPNCRTTSCHPYEKQTVQVRELYMVNPCSHEGIDEIMSHVKKCCSVRSDCERKWTILVSDGVPYILASDIQDKFYICNIAILENTEKILPMKNLIVYSSLLSKLRAEQVTNAEQFS